jgi:hypothetical protein
MARTEFPQAEEHLRPILDALAEVAEFLPGPGTTLRGDWHAGARRLYPDLLAAGIPESEHPAFIRWAVQEMRDRFKPQPPLIKSPGSLVFLVPIYVQARQQRMQFQDFWDD